MNEMKANDKVILVTVTFNSSNYLERLLKSLRNSTINLYKIIIVDNKSKLEHLKKIDELVNDENNIEVLHLESNLGGAGGFQKGVQHVVDNYPECDWVWLMDDDAFPKEDCLEQLLSYKNLGNLGCLAPVIYGVEWEKYQLYHHKEVTKYLNDGIAVCDLFDELPEYTKFDTDAFVGPLIRKKVIDSIGVPDGSLFIYGDDREYTYRLTRKYNMYLIKNAVIFHRDTKEDDISIWKMYYKYRNKILFIKKYSSRGWDKVCGELLVFYEMFKELVKIFVRNKYVGKKKKYVKYLFMSVKDGIIGHTGKLVDPIKF